MTPDQFNYIFFVSGALAAVGLAGVVICLISFVGSFIDHNRMWLLWLLGAILSGGMIYVGVLGPIVLELPW